MKFASAAWVFPGGVYDVADGPCQAAEDKVKSLRRCALRETFEEVGICPFPGLEAPTLEGWRAWRERVHDDAGRWEAMLNEHGAGGLGGGGDATDILPATCFLTPEFEAARSGRQYETHFFVTQIEKSEEVHLSCDVDKNETVRALWVSPSEAVRRSREGELHLFPPQFYILSRLADVEAKGIDSAMQEASTFSPGDAPNLLSRIMQPHPVAGEEGGMALTLPFDEMHATCPGPGGARHRVEGFPKKMSVVMNSMARVLLDPSSSSARL